MRLPDADNAYDIGSANYKVRDLYVSDNSLWVGDVHKISISGGQLKFRKRKQDILPHIVSQAGGSSSSAIAFAASYDNNNAITQLSQLKLKHWLAYLRSFSGFEGKSIQDIFRDNADDYEEESEASYWVKTNNSISTDAEILVNNTLTVVPSNLVISGGADGYLLTTNGSGVVGPLRRKRVQVKVPAPFR